MRLPVKSFGEWLNPFIEINRNEALVHVTCKPTLITMTPKQAIDLAQALIEAAFEGGPESPLSCYGDKYTQIAGCHCQKIDHVNSNHHLPHRIHCCCLFGGSNSNGPLPSRD